LSGRLRGAPLIAALTLVIPVIANGLVYLPEMNAKKIRIFTTGGDLVSVFLTGEFTM
jgi:hypothetical protein